jgi:two-component system, response regulator
VSRRRVLLLVEDSQDDLDLALRAFEKAKVVNEIVVARDGKEALEYLFSTGVQLSRDPSAFPEVVLLDLNLPKVSGLEVLRRMRADSRTRRVPVVVLTSSAEEKDVISSYDFGANSFVRKPVDFSQFVLAAQQQLGLYWLALNRGTASAKSLATIAWSRATFAKSPATNPKSPATNAKSLAAFARSLATFARSPATIARPLATVPRPPADWTRSPATNVES